MLVQLVSWDLFSFQVHFFALSKSLVLINLPFQSSYIISAQCKQVAALKWPAMLLENTEICRTFLYMKLISSCTGSVGNLGFKGRGWPPALASSNSTWLEARRRTAELSFRGSNKDSRWNSGGALYFSFRFLNLRSHVNVCLLHVLRSFLFLDIISLTAVTRVDAFL